MSPGPPLPADVWNRLPPEARALIQALQAELRAKVRARLPSGAQPGSWSKSAPSVSRVMTPPAAGTTQMAPW
jgi:hypothetical protein